MRICVFGAASNDIDAKYVRDVESLCTRLAKAGHNLVFGAGASGLMGAAARGFKDGGADVIGVIPEFFKAVEVEPIFDRCDELIFTETMRERKAIMEDKADAFIIVPGGIGTFEEFFEVLTLKQLGRHNKPIAMYNIEGYYDSMDSMMHHSIYEKFVSENCKKIYAILSSEDALVDYIERVDVPKFTIREMKKN